VNPDIRSRSGAVAPRQGIAWLFQSLALVRAQPGRLLLMAVLLQIIMGLTQVPLVGILLLLSVPALSAGLLQAFHVTAQGGVPSPGLLFAALTSRDHTGRLLGMGALMLLIGIVSVAVMLPTDDAMLDPELLSRIEQGDLDAVAAIDMETLRAMVVAFLVGLSISGTLSYMTVPLIWFGDRKLGAALAEGLRALVVNWKAFLVLGLGLVGLMVPVSLVAGVLFTYADSAGPFSMLIMAVVLLLVLAFQLLLFGTQYCAFRDVFGVGSKPEPPGSGDEGQLVA
jgi:hypothetical protein